ncbi:hypothetical protein K438DRAFT_2020522 [Mycena galopus ATCC 62051]|nr:hypothetical protein K438DRAFT_2020522 [Mycena galopus ATCC 62051]
MVMSVTDAVRWAIVGPLDPTLRLEDKYPQHPTTETRNEAWIDDNRDSILEAMTVLIATRPDRFEPGATVYPTSTFSLNREVYFNSVPIYYNPSVIEVEHEAFSYTVSTPDTVAALHAIPDKEGALAYLEAHYDKRQPVSPRRLIVPPDWYPGKPLTFVHRPLDSPPQSLEGKIRYTLFDWRKHRVYRTAFDMHAIHCYYVEHYDLKEILDAEGNAVSSEQGHEYVPGSELRENHESVSRL